MRVKGHQVRFQNHHLSVITNLFTFFWIKPTWAFKQQPVDLILEANALI